MELLNSWHDHFSSGHLGLNKTYECLRSTYFWNKFVDLQHWNKHYVSYAQKKRDVHYSKPPLLPIAICGPWEVITRNCMGSLPVTNLGNWYIIVGNLFTKHIVTAVLLSIETAIITQMLLDKTVLRHSPSHRFLTDRGTNFTSKLLMQLCIDQFLHQATTSSVIVLLNVSVVLSCR